MFIRPLWGGTSTPPLLAKTTAFWPMEEGATVSRLDSHASYDLAQVGLPPVDTGIISNCVRFSVSDKLTYATAPSALKLAGDRTFALWYKHEIAFGAAQLYGIDDAGSNREYSLTHSGGAGASLTLFTWNSTATLKSVNNAANLQDGVWYFIVIYYDQAGEEIGLSVNNGAFSTKAVADTAMKTSTTLDFAVGYSDGGGWLDGSIDEFGIYDEVLTGEDLIWLYNGGSGRTYSEFI